MFDWDDLRVFLAAARNETVRGAAKQLGTTHATVSRRLRRLEAALAADLFERSPQGRVLTRVGTHILSIAETMERQAGEIDRKAAAEESGLDGKILFSVADTLYLAVVGPILSAFQAEHPGIELEIATTDRHVSLDQREADVVARLTNTPPDSAFGRKIADSPLGCFAGLDYLEERPDPDHWVALTYKATYEPIVPARIVAVADSALISAQLIENGVGIGLLPCYLGDTRPGLRRVPGIGPIPHLALWTLVHADMRTKPRVRLLVDHLYAALESERGLIEGRRPIIQPVEPLEAGRLP